MRVWVAGGWLAPWIAVILVLLVACSDRGRETDPAPGSGIEDVSVLQGQVLWNGPALGMGRTLAAQGQRLFVTDKSGDPFIHVIDLATGSAVRSYGMRGEGPGDFTGIMSLSRRSGTVWAFDLGLRRLTALEAGPQIDRVRTVAAPEAVVPMDMVWLGPERILVVGALDTNRFLLADSTGRVLRTVRGELLGPDTIPIVTRMNLSTGFNVCASAEAERFALAFVGAGRIDIHDLDAKLVARAQVPRPTNGSFLVDSTGRVRGNTNDRHYEGCSATPARLYALYSGWEITRREDWGRVQATIVEAYSWTGRLEGSWRLDRSVGAITVVGDTVLYAASTEGDGIIRYALR